jgi:ureidoacrylate peracid hydrolase
LRNLRPTPWPWLLRAWSWNFGFADASEAARQTANFRCCVFYGEDFTALLIIDPYNDFISEGGKVWGRIRAVAEGNHCVPHMLQVLNAARKAGLRVFYALHRRYRPGDYETWKYIAPIQNDAWAHKTFEYGTWGGEIRSKFEPKPRNIVAAEHWSAALPIPIWICS